jgi:hypothetical protein
LFEEAWIVLERRVTGIGFLAQKGEKGLEDSSDYDKKDQKAQVKSR